MLELASPPPPQLQVLRGQPHIPKNGTSTKKACLKYPHLTMAQRVKLIHSCGKCLLDPPISLDPILAYLTDQPKEVKRAGAELLAACLDVSKNRGK